MALPRGDGGRSPRDLQSAADADLRAGTDDHVPADERAAVAAELPEPHGSGRRVDRARHRAPRLPFERRGIRPAGDVDADALRAEPAARAELGAQGRKGVVAAYSWPSVARRTAEVYAELAATRGRPASTTTSAPAGQTRAIASNVASSR